MIECEGAAAVVVVLSLHPPNHPGVAQVVVLVVEVDVGDELVEVVTVVRSLQPNQPGVLHVEVVVVDVDDDVVVVVVLVLSSSRQPHQPGVLHVAVRVRVLVAVEDGFDVVVDSVPLLSYIFQFAQSRHSGVKLHSGTVSYLSITSWMTERILWVPMPTRQPLSATTSYTHSRPVWHADSMA